ncbi:MAG: M28 family peptidase [Bacteroidales bacterium]|nr:M28 family peptidase [Bacteroidales bacterium]
MKSIISFFIILTILSACRSRKSDLEEVIRNISVNDLENYVKELGSDRFMGRKPFTEGETITVNYLADQLRLIGFEPAFDGSYFQKVPLAEISSTVSEIAIAKSSKILLKLRTPDDAAIISPVLSNNITINEIDIVFAGFGIVAPEYGWNDYAGLDVKGKTVVVMVNDPGLYTSDITLFKGREMTYYGRWTYKYEEAARQGAAGVLIIHETTGAGYPYTIPRKSSLSPRLYLNDTTKNEPLCSFTGWLTSDAARKLFSINNLNVDSLRLAACNKGYRGFPLNLSITLEIKNDVRFSESSNVAGMIRGSAKPRECIVYTAHWDHFGIGEKEDGDSIYNGAVDNGTAMAWELAIGKAFSALRRKPARSIILLFPTAEEQGLIGSFYYTEHPVIPVENIVACINNDGMLPLGKMKDVTITGFGQSNLDSLVGKIADTQNRYVIGDPESHTGMYFRSDHYSFAAKGIPSLYAKGSTESREHGIEWTAGKRSSYIENRYHRPSDNYYPGEFNFEGIAEDAVLSFIVGYELAISDFYPEWRSGSEFKQLRNR